MSCNENSLSYGCRRHADCRYPHSRRIWQHRTPPRRCDSALQNVSRSTSCDRFCITKQTSAFRRFPKSCGFSLSHCSSTRCEKSSPQNSFNLGASTDQSISRSILACCDYSNTGRNNYFCIAKFTNGNAENNAPSSPIRIAAISACPTGIAHTYMTTDALTSAAKARGDASLLVETQGTSDNSVLSEKEIASPDVVIFAADVGVRDRERFKGKRILECSPRHP